MTRSVTSQNHHFTMPRSGLVQPLGKHNEPHFHAYYQEHSAVVTIAPVLIIAGSLPRKQQRLVEAWAGCTKKS
jgi:hypothetical protein